MNRNQKIAVGCGAAGCLGLIVLAIIGIGAYLYFERRPTSNDTNRNSSYNFNTNRNGNTSTNENVNSNANANSNASNSSPSSTSSGSMSEDDKHKLYQAAATTTDTELMHRVWKKIGLMGDDNVPNENMAVFAKDHFVWLLKNTDFLQEINTPEKARAYVNAHLNE